jgi:OOP family OmpA-OmpF porin
MRLLTIIGALGALAFLAGCASNITQMENVQATGGTPFTQALAEEYRAFVADEKAERDWHAADYYAVKGLSAAGGQMVLPEEVPQAGDHTQALTDGRARLIAALDGGARDGNPAAAAKAQVAFDCWQHEAQEDFWYDTLTDDHVKPCRDKFEAAMAELGPTAMAQTPANTYVVLFDFDMSNINAAARAVIERALADAKAKGGNVHVTDTGHTDRAGTEEYNTALSLRRADSVRDALISGGIPADAITVAGRGESEPAVPTADGVRKQANRRVELILQ